jgi:hypothetical protein
MTVAIRRISNIPDFLHPEATFGDARLLPKRFLRESYLHTRSRWLAPDLGEFPQ